MIDEESLIRLVGDLKRASKFDPHFGDPNLCIEQVLYIVWKVEEGKYGN